MLKLVGIWKQNNKPEERTIRPPLVSGFLSSTPRIAGEKNRHSSSG
jgi:hypothetical protein